VNLIVGRKRRRMLKLPKMPDMFTTVVLWISLAFMILFSVVGSFDWCWNNAVVKLFDAPTLSFWNALAVVGMVGMLFGSSWLMLWLVVSSLREAK
jgi:hypothetical protein